MLGRSSDAAGGAGTRPLAGSGLPVSRKGGAAEAGPAATGMDLLLRPGRVGLDPSLGEVRALGGGGVLLYVSRGTWVHSVLFYIYSYSTTVNSLSLDGDGSFRDNRGSDTIKTVGE